MVGNVRLMEQIGEGGFGLVFVADQVQPVRRKVALKLIKPGMDSRQVIARFEGHAGGAVLMDYPGIAPRARRQAPPSLADLTSSWSWSAASRSPSIATSTN